MLARRGQPNPVADAEAVELYRKHLLHVAMHIGGRPNMELLTIQHREALQDPLRCAQRIQRFVGRRLDTAAMARAVDARLYRNRAPGALCAS